MDLVVAHLFARLRYRHEQSKGEKLIEGSTIERVLSRSGLQNDSRTGWQSFSKHRDGLISRNHDLQSFETGIQVTTVIGSSIARLKSIY